MSTEQSSLMGSIGSCEERRLLVGWITKATESIWGNVEVVNFSLKLRENIWSRINWLPRDQQKFQEHSLALDQNIKPKVNNQIKGRMT